MIIDARDRLVHFLDGGASFEAMLVIKMTKDGKEVVHVPLWDENTTMRDVMEVTFHNLLKMVEDFTAGFLTLRIREGLNLVHIPVKTFSVESPWKAVTPEQMSRIKGIEAAVMY